MIALSDARQGGKRLPATIKHFFWQCGNVRIEPPSSDEWECTLEMKMSALSGRRMRRPYQRTDLTQQHSNFKVQFTSA